MTLSEQQTRVNFLDEFLEKENDIQRKCKIVIEQIELIKKSILAKAFHGELGTNNPEEESAIELLKKILE